MCIYCHQQIHDLFTNKELYEEFNTLPSLRKEFAMRLARQVLNGFDFLRETIEADHASVAQVDIVYPPCIDGAGKREDVGSSPIAGFESDVSYIGEYTGLSTQ